MVITDLFLKGELRMRIMVIKMPKIFGNLIKKVLRMG